MGRRTGALLLAAAGVLWGGCTRPEPAGETAAEVRAAGRQVSREAEIERELVPLRARIVARGDSLEETLGEVGGLTRAESRALRRDVNRVQVARARAMGVRPGGQKAHDRLRERGALVPLEDSTRYWTVRELDYSVPLVTPDTRALLVEIGERFQARLDSLGLPPLRFQVTSVLRTDENQEALRRINANAASGTSAHQFGTTVDISYIRYSAPPEPAADLRPASAPALEPHLQQVQGLVLEAAAERQSGQLRAVLGRVLRELREEGKVLVMMENRQAVYHITVADRFADRRAARSD